MLKGYSLRRVLTKWGLIEEDIKRASENDRGLERVTMFSLDFAQPSFEVEIFFPCVIGVVLR